MGKTVARKIHSSSFKKSIESAYKIEIDQSVAKLQLIMYYHHTQ